MTAFSAIVAAFVEKLTAAPAISAHICRANTRQVPETSRDAINVFWEASQPTEGTIAGAPIDWQSRIIVDCYARSTATSGDIAVDPLTEAVYQRLAADTTLGGLVFHIGTPQIEGDFDAAAQKTGWTRLTYIVEHRTNFGELN